MQKIRRLLLQYLSFVIFFDELSTFCVWTVMGFNLGSLHPNRQLAHLFSSLVTPFSEIWSGTCPMTLSGRCTPAIISKNIIRRIMFAPLWSKTYDPQKSRQLFDHSRDFMMKAHFVFSVVRGSRKCCSTENFSTFCPTGKF